MKPHLARYLLALPLIAAYSARPAQAAPTFVLTDSGSIGEFTFTNTGMIGSTAVINAAVPSITSQVNTVNGAIVAPELAAVNGPVTLLVTPTGGGLDTLALIPGDYVKTIGATVGQQAKLSFNLSEGTTTAVLPNFFNASGPVTHLLANGDPLYDFSNFAGGKGTINFTFTATSFTGTDSFAGLFTTVGATAVGNGSFSQASIPEASSIVLLGSGLLILLAWSRIKSR